MRTPDVLIAGAGIIGLSAALELATHGLIVTVLEQAVPMREASWAAAGMLAAHDPENPPGLLPLSNHSLALYPAFLARIEHLSGHRIPVRTHTTLQGLHTGSGSGTLDSNALQARLPGLNPGSYSFLELPEQSLDPRDLCHALPLAAKAAGVDLREQTTVLGVERDGRHLLVSTTDGEFRARHYVHCTGAWAGNSLRAAATLPVEPRKGQILAVTMPAGAPVLDCVIRTPKIYLVPRSSTAEREKRIVIGASVERAGFDRSISPTVNEVLLATAAELWPPIRAGVVADCWTGLRPSTPDGLPILSELSSGHATSAGDPNIWAATGHFRNGILLAPGTASLLTQLILGDAPSIDLHAFRAARFAEVEALS